MSRFIIKNEDGTYLEEIESMERCKWRINEVCCNEKCDCCGDYPCPSFMCEDDDICGCFEKEDGILKGENNENI